MNLIINPGSGEVGDSGEGWTNTHKQARLNAYTMFYRPMLEQGFTDIEVIDTKEEVEGRWKFIFKHKITGKEVELETHGIDNMEAYCKEHIFGSRIYWNGSSSGNPELSDFAAEGYEPILTYVEKDEEHE